MKIIEVRDGFIKFEADKSIYLSSFIQVDGMSKSYIAQVNQLKSFGDIMIASAKILFLYDGSGLKNYDNTEPSKDSQISTFTLDILNNSINAQKPIIIGKTLDELGSIKIDASAFDKKMLISVDDMDMNNMLIQNFSKQFENLGMKTIVIDTLGVASTNKYKAGVDFKIPLNTSSLVFMYESCLNDATAESKSTIVEIFRDLSEYSKTVPFVPFDTLKTIVDDMVDKQHVFKLFVLKNKLAKFAKLGYFASKQEEAECLDKILEQQSVIIDLSGMDILFQNKYLSLLYEKLNKLSNIQVFLETANTVSKKNLKNILSESSVPTTLITHSRYQYLNDIKNMFDNFVIEPTLANNTVFRVYSTFLGSMDKDMYLTAGEAINYIPIVSKMQVIDEVAEYTAEQEIAPENENIMQDDVIQEDDVNIEETVLEENYDSEEIIPTDEENNAEVIPQDEIIASIDKKSDDAIASITESFEEPEEINLFDNEEDTQENNIAEEEQESSDDIKIDDEHIEEPTVELEEDFTQEESEDTLIEMEDDEANNQELEEDSLISDLAEVNEEAVYIGEIPNEDIVIEEPENDESVQSEELSEEMLEENIDVANDDEIISNDDDSSLQMDAASEELAPQELEFVDDDAEAETETEETTVELDNDTEILLDDQDNYEPDEYPQDTTMDVDFSEPKIMPLSGEALNHDFDEIVELDPSDADEDDIIVDISNDEQINIDEDAEQKIIEEVDKVYTTIKEDDGLEEISDSDLDLIDELNNDGEELEEYQGNEIEEFSGSNEGILEEVHPEPAPQENDAEEILEHKASSTPIVPLYDADIPQEDMVVSDPIQQGDAVLHAKYGNGVVEKMIKYGNKTLYAINFENIGRRLLDPTLTEIKRV